MTGLPSSTKKRWLSSKLLLLGGVILLLFVSTNLFKSWNKSQEINQEINILTQEVNTIKKDNVGLSELIKYLNSTAYLEEKARTDLGLKKEGEQTIVISDLKDSLSMASKSISPEEENLPVSNSKKWWRHFFTHQ